MAGPLKRDQQDPLTGNSAKSKAPLQWLWNDRAHGMSLFKGGPSGEYIIYIYIYIYIYLQKSIIHRTNQGNMLIYNRSSLPKCIFLILTTYIFRHNLFKTYTKHVPNISQTYPKHVPNTSNKCPKHVRIRPRPQPL